MDSTSAGDGLERYCLFRELVVVVEEGGGGTGERIHVYL